MRTQTDIKQLVGRIGDDYYICDYLFEHDKDFKGATATVLCSVSQEDYENRTDPENRNTIEHFEEVWREQVKVGHTTKGLESFVEEVLDIDGDEAVFDFSGYDYWDLLREAVPELTEKDYPVFECVGGGRSFSKDMVFDEVYNEELWQKIKKIES